MKGSAQESILWRLQFFKVFIGIAFKIITIPQMVKQHPGKWISIDYFFRTCCIRINPAFRKFATDINNEGGGI
jgi:hypothetical protein